MKLYCCLLTLHDNVFFATREMGILYETEKYFHNWALSYAFFKSHYIPHPYRLSGEKAQKPDYLDSNEEQNLCQLNDLGIYVFPAKPLHWSYQINTFKSAQVSFYGKSEQFGSSGNYPINYGRAKEIAVGSQYCTYLLVDETKKPNIILPQWIRLGKWLAKIKVDYLEIPHSCLQIKQNDTFFCDHPLNPLDLLPDVSLLLYNRIVMTPASLLSQSQLKGSYYQIDLSGSHTEEWRKTHAKQLQELHLPRTFCLPFGVAYGASYVTI